jgi:hypothetical protein
MLAQRQGRFWQCRAVIVELNVRVWREVMSSLSTDRSRPPLVTSVVTTKITWLMMFIDAVALYSDNHTKPIKAK